MGSSTFFSLPHSHGRHLDDSQAPAEYSPSPHWGVNLAFAPFLLFSAGKDFITACKQRNSHQRLHSGIKLLSTAMRSGTSFFILSKSSTNFSFIPPLVYSKFLSLTGSTGLIISLIEGFLEMRGLMGVQTFRNDHLSPELSRLIVQKPYSSLEKRKLINQLCMSFRQYLSRPSIGREAHSLISEFTSGVPLLGEGLDDHLNRARACAAALPLKAIFNSVFSLPEQECMEIRKEISSVARSALEKETLYRQEIEHRIIEKQRDFALRVSPWAANRFFNEIQGVFEKLQSDDPALKEQGIQQAHQLLSLIDTQTKKKLLIHIIGLIGIALCGLAFSFAIFELDFPWFAGVFIASMVFGGIHWVLLQGVFTEEGWKLSFKNLVPKSVFSAITWIKEAPNRQHYQKTSIPTIDSSR